MATMDPMVTMTVRVDDVVLERIRALAELHGRSLAEVAEDLLGSLAVAGPELDDEDEQKLFEASEELARGEHVSEDKVFAALRALRR